MSEQAQQLININIDGTNYQVPAGTNLVDAVALAGKEIPHYCYHPKLSVVGNCRMCLVEMGTPMRDRATGELMLEEDGSPKIGWMPKPAIACASKATPDLHVRLNSPMTADARHGVLEFLLVNHPLDCPICDQAGECRLQEFATDYGRGYSRFVENKNVKPKRTVIGPRVILDDERCILCSRCIRFCNEIDKNPVLGFTERGSYTTLTTFPGKQLDSNYSLNTVDLCPVGALTSTDFRFQMRVWFLKRSKSICTESSVGVNTEVWSREGKIYRVTPRRNDAVNDTWMSDSGRELYKIVEHDDRLLDYRVGGHKAGIADAVRHAAELLSKGQGSIAYVGSGHMSVEEQWMLRRLQGLAAGQVVFAAHLKDGDGRLISTDRTPNVRGALLTGLIDSVPTQKLPEDFIAKVRSGAITTIVSFGEDLTALGLSSAELEKLDIIYFGVLANATSDFAKVQFPALTVFEKSGSFVNQQFRLQRFEQIVPGPAGVLPQIMLIDRIAAALGGTGAALATATAQVSPVGIWKELAQEVPQFAGVEFRKIGDFGILLDAAAFAGLTFPEGKSLHYEPAAAAAAVAAGA